MLVSQLLKIDPGGRYLIVMPPGAAEFWQADPERVSVMYERARNYSVREVALLGYRLHKARPLLVHQPHYAGPLIRTWRSVVTIHDVIHLHFPEYQKDPRARVYARIMFRRAVASDRIIVPSESTKADLVSKLRADAKRIRVIPEAADPLFKPRPRDVARSTAKRYGLTHDYLISVGTFKPHKNLSGLLHVFSELLKQHSWTGQLAIVGPLAESSSIGALIAGLGLEGRVRLTGFVPDQDLVDLYCAATALIHPSRFEGFGLTILEAMACGLPVIAVANSSIPEVAGDAAILVGASPVDLFEGTLAVVRQGALRQTLSHAGLEQASKFSWESAARATLAVYEELN